MLRREYKEGTYKRGVRGVIDPECQEAINSMQRERKRVEANKYTRFDILDFED